MECENGTECLNNICSHSSRDPLLNCECKEGTKTMFDTDIKCLPTGIIKKKK